VQSENWDGKAMRKTKWFSPDLAQRLEPATSYLCGMLDADQGDEPFFHITRRDDETAFAATPWR